MKNTLSIRAQLITGIVITTIAGISLIGVFSITVIESSSLRSVVSKARLVSDVVRSAYFSQEIKPVFGKSYFKNLMEEMGSNEYVINDLKGKAIIRKNRLKEYEGDVVFYKDNIKVVEVGKSLFSGIGEKLVVTIYKDIPGGTEIAKFSVDLYDIKDNVNTAKKFLLFYVIFDSIVIIFFGVYVLSNSVVRPLRELEKTAKEISDGALNVRANIKGDNEISHVAESFNVMSERLLSEIERLAALNEELSQAQKELIREKTLASVGRLAAGIAHEIGNPLGAIQGYIEILKGDIDNIDEKKEIVERADKELLRIDSIVKEFLDIARPGKESVMDVQVNMVIKEAVSLLSHDKNFKEISFKEDLSDDLPLVRAEADKLKQIIINSFMNSSHALKGIGEISVSTSVVDFENIESDYLKNLNIEEKENDYIKIIIQDNGCGISKENMEKIFDPFFTTKDVSRGTGLGLFMADSIIKAYGGSVEVVSIEDEGTSFIFYLPQAGE